MDRTEQEEKAKRKLRAAILEQYGGYEGLAAEIGISHQAVSDVVNGHTTGATARYAVAAALNCRPADFWPAEAQPAEDEPVGMRAAG